MVPTRQEQLHRALTYPYDIPDRSYLFDPATGAASFPDEAALLALAQGRTAVLAVGSNGSVSALGRKFPPDGGYASIPLLRTVVHDHDSAYVALVSRYGSLPATLVSAPGTRATMHVTFLDDLQLEQMHRTESVPVTYEVVEVVTGSVAAPWAAARAEPVLAYEAVVGPVLHLGRAIALADIPAEGRTLPALTEAEVLALVAARLGQTVEDLVFGVIDDAEHKAHVNEVLGQGL
jgi:hypothetical protein